jgi:hypothetical protein
VLASAAWIVLVVGLAVYEYTQQNVFCGFGVGSPPNILCVHRFWEWAPIDDLGPFTPVEPGTIVAPLVFTPKIWVMLLTLLLPPVALFALGFGVGWVRRGFAPQV